MPSDNTSSAGTLPTYSGQLLTNRGEAKRLRAQQKTYGKPKRRLICIRFLECHCRTVTRPHTRRQEPVASDWLTRNRSRPSRSSNSKRLLGAANWRAHSCSIKTAMRE
jgi:hypothetical protein